MASSQAENINTGSRVITVNEDIPTVSRLQPL